jgi:hypothetical protein
MNDSIYEKCGKYRDTSFGKKAAAISMRNEFCNRECGDATTQRLHRSENKSCVCCDSHICLSGMIRGKPGKINACDDFIS